MFNTVSPPFSGYGLIELVLNDHKLAYGKQIRYGAKKTGLVLEHS